MKSLRMTARFAGPVMSPLGKRTVSKADADLVREYGVGVIDCSWAKVDETAIARLKAPNARLRMFAFFPNEQD